MKRPVAALLCLLAVTIAFVLPSLSARAAEPIKIGFYGPLTGPLAVACLPAKRAVELAVKQINEKGGVLGRPIEVIYADTKFDNNESIRIVNRFIRSDKVAAVLGDFTSTGTMATLDITQRANIPHMDYNANSTAITNSGYNHIFRLVVNSHQLYSGLASYAQKKLGMKRVAIMGWDDDFGRANVDAFTKYQKTSKAFEIVALEWYNVNTKEFKGLLSKVLAQKPDSIVLTGAIGDSALIVKQARELGYQGMFLGDGGQSILPFRNIAGPSADGTVVATQYVPHYYKNPLAVAFDKQWAEMKYESDPWSSHAYDAFMLLLDAMQRAGTTDGLKVIAALRATKDWQGVTGTTNFYPDGDVERPVFMQKWVDGKLTPLEPVQAPFRN